MNETIKPNLQGSAKVTVWDIPSSLMPIVEKEVKKFEVKHGMFAAIPLICKGPSCPYRKTCKINDSILPIDQRCPVEIAAIIARFEHWCNHFGIKCDGDVIDDTDIVDATLIRDLVDNEVQVLRAENRLALSADFIEQTISTVDNKGNPYYKYEVSPGALFKLQLLDKRYKILQLLNSTRKDKSKEVKLELTPSQQAASIFSKIEEKMGKIDISTMSTIPASSKPTEV